MAQVAANGATFSVEDAGAGDPPFVFVHGYASDSTAWLPQFEDLSRDHRCINVDLRGRGGSEAVPPFGIAQQAEDLAAIITALGVPPAIVVGHSLGGVVALTLNARHPELVLGIVCGDSPLRRDPSARKLVEAIEAAGSMEPLNAVLDKSWGEGAPESVRGQVRATAMSCLPEVGIGMLSDLEEIGAEMPDLLKAADRKPFMAFWAQRPLGDPSWLRDHTMFLRQEPIAGAGHFFQLEQPAITNALLRAFLDDVERDPRIGRVLSPES